MTDCEPASAGILVLPKEITFSSAGIGADFEAALVKAMTESVSTVPLVIHGDTVAMGCIAWKQQSFGRPRWKVSGA
jgi:hypothetical protein